jgi:hypothetical protein
MEALENDVAIRDAIHISQLTHYWVDRKGWTNQKKALEHNIGMFLISERYGPDVASSIGYANELRGLTINDRQNGNMTRALLGQRTANGRSTAFEWGDLYENGQGIIK